MTTAASPPVLHDIGELTRCDCSKLFWASRGKLRLAGAHNWFIGAMLSSGAFFLGF